jgi:hypothetical protein
MAGAMRLRRARNPGPTLCNRRSEWATQEDRCGCWRRLSGIKFAFAGGLFGWQAAAEVRSLCVEIFGLCLILIRQSRTKRFEPLRYSSCARSAGLPSHRRQMKPRSWPPSMESPQFLVSSSILWRRTQRRRTGKKKGSRGKPSPLKDSALEI